MPANKGKEATQGTLLSIVAAKAKGVKLTPDQIKKLDVDSYKLQTELTAAAKNRNAKM